MRVVSGKVVGNTVVLDESLPDGSAVDVVLRVAGEDDWELSDADKAELLRAAEEAETEEAIPADVVLAQLRAIVQAEA